MDPLSILASVTGILAVAAKITTVVTKFIQGVGDVPASTRSVLTEVSDLSLCLSQLTPFLRGTRTAERTRRDGISVEQVVAISTSLVLSTSELEKLLDSFKLDLAMSAFARIQWVRNEERIDRILNRIRASRSSLNLILTIFTCTSMEAAQTSICNLATTVEHILQASEDVSSRLARIETMFAVPTGYSASTHRAPIDDDNEIAQPQVSTEEPLNFDLNRRILHFDPNLESELHASRVYMRTKHRHSMSSLTSTYDSVAGLSFLSGISLAQISSIPVISLPIFSYELWNPQQYRDIRSTDMSASLRAQNPIDSTTESRYDASDTKSRGLAPKVTAGLLGFLDGVQVKSRLAAEKRRSARIDQMLDEEKRRSARIDQMLDEEKKYKDPRTNLLILGAGGSGKTTVLKQMRLSYSEGFSLEDREEARAIIFDNILMAFEIIFEEMKERKLSYTSKAIFDNEILLREVYSKSSSVQTTKYPPDVLSAIKATYADAGFQKAVEKGNEYALHDNFQYYIAHIDRVFSPSYLPNDQDVLFSRVRTSGITKTHLKFGKASVNVFDIGGARSERKKWRLVFEGCHSLLFLASLSGYNECLVEDKTENQMQEALLLFESILPLSWFRETAITLLLTKLDLFEEKIKEKPIRHYFPDYTGRSDDSAAGLRFFVGKFLSLAESSGRKIEVFYTDVTNTKRFDSILHPIVYAAIRR